MLKKYPLILFLVIAIAFGSMSFAAEEAATLYFFGRASVRIDLKDGRVIYIDPYATSATGYKKPADIILITHQHSDHNKIGLVTKKSSYENIQCPYHIKAGDVVTVDDIEIRAVQAYNSHHSSGTCCGFVITIGDLVIYHSGDTSTTKEMKEMAKYDIDYALLCMDDYYNMGPVEAMKVSDLIKAKHVIPIHTSKSGYYDQKNVDRYTDENKIAMKPGDSIKLYK